MALSLTTSVPQVAIATLFQLGCIYIAHLCFRRGLQAQGYDLKKLPFQGFGTPYAQWVALVVVVFVFGCEFYLACWPFGEKGSASTFFSSYLAAPLFFFDYFAYKVRSSCLFWGDRANTYLHGLNPPSPPVSRSISY